MAMLVRDRHRSVINIEVETYIYLIHIRYRIYIKYRHKSLLFCLNGPTIGRLKLKPSEGTRVDGEESDYRSWQCTVIRKENILILDIPMHNLPIVHE